MIVKEFLIYPSYGIAMIGALAFIVMTIAPLLAELIKKDDQE